MNRLMYVLLLCLFFSSAQAGIGTRTGKVDKVTFHSAVYEPYATDSLGIAFIHVTGLPGACTSSSPRVAIGTDHPLYESVVSAALSAQATQKDVTIQYVDACTIRSTAWDFATFSIN